MMGENISRSAKNPTLPILSYCSIITRFVSFVFIAQKICRIAQYTNLKRLDNPTIFG